VLVVAVCTGFVSICFEVIGPVENCSSSFDEVRKKYLRTVSTQIRCARQVKSAQNTVVCAVDRMGQAEALS
jgi:hypothetical protein